MTARPDMTRLFARNPAVAEPAPAGQPAPAISPAPPPAAGPTPPRGPRTGHQTGPETRLRPLAMAGAAASLGLLAALVIWARLTPIGGAVIAPGQVVVEGDPAQVQNLDGGIVEAIHVANGDLVTKGQLLVRLDPTLLRVNLDIYRNRLAEALARKVRLEAEQAGRPAADLAGLEASGALSLLAGLPMAQHHEGQRQILAARAEVLRGRSEQLREKILQFGHQITGIEGLIAAKQEQLGYTDRELTNLRTLSDQGLARESQVLDLERGRADLLGQIAAQQSDLAGIANSVRDTEMEILQTERQFREEVVTELREVAAEADELILQIVTTQKQLDRVELRAPVAGMVHEMTATTLGGVVAPGATVLEIVPVSEGMEFALRLDPRSIDAVHLGQRARVTFPAFNARTTPQLYGTLTGISPTTVIDPATGQGFYRLKLTIAPEELARLGTAALVPGMPVEAFLDTGARPALDYLTRPLTDQLARAFRDD